MLVRLHGEGLEPTLVEMAGAGGPVVGVPALGVRQREPAHEPGEVPIPAGPEQEVEVAGHQAVDEQPHVVTSDRLGQDPLECLVIVVGLEDG